MVVLVLEFQRKLGFATFSANVFYDYTGISGFEVPSFSNRKVPSLELRALCFLHFEAQVIDSNGSC